MPSHFGTEEAQLQKTTLQSSGSLRDTFKKVGQAQASGLLPELTPDVLS